MMMRLSKSTAEAFESWFPHHRASFPAINWPDDDDTIGIYHKLAAILVKNGVVDSVQLHEITQRMLIGSEKAYDLQGHIQLLLKTAIAFQRELYPRDGAPDPESMDGARLASKDCDTCGGMGIFLAHRQKSYDPGRRDNTINVYCRCPYGRKIRENHKANNPDAFKRFYDIDQYPFLAGDEFRTPRSDPQTEAFHRRCARIVDWLHAQAPDVQDRWRDVAFAGLSPGVLRNHPHADDFVAGVIANRHPEFEG
jgi:hypothetical protein